MPDNVYLDTSAVLRWAFCVGGSPLPRDKAGHDTMERLLAGDHVLVVSPITLIEVTTNLVDKVRDLNGWYAGYDAPQAEATIAALMRHLGSGGRIRARSLSPRAFEMAMMWVAEAVRIRGSRLKAWDALHLSEAVRWARELGEGQVVKLATSNSDFEDFLRVLPELRAHVVVLNVCAP